MITPLAAYFIYSVPGYMHTDSSFFGTQAAAAVFSQPSRWWGPVTARRLAFTAALYGMLLLTGLLLMWFATTPGWIAFGMGLLLPGGGFLAYADLGTFHGLMHLGIAALALVLFVLGLMLWFASGNVLAPPLVWLLAALGAAAMDHGPIHTGAREFLLGLLVLVAGGMIGAALLRHATARVARREANAYLSGAGQTIAARLREGGGTAPQEYSFEDVKRMRFLLDRALQPVQDFNGFEQIDQFQTAAIRYQLNFIGYALSMAQATRLPALGSYLDEAQRRLIEKQSDHRVWRYWSLENMWGNLSLNPDPLARDNIMFTGFCALQMAMFQAASGRRDYERPGSFRLHHPSGRIFSSDFPSLIEGLDHERRRSAFHLIACEPNWIYPLCNTMGAAAMKARDAQSVSTYWADGAGLFRQNLENEFIDPFGRFIPCRSAYTGLSLPVIGGAMPQAMTCFFLNAAMPDIALRQWLLLRRSLLASDKGRSTLRRRSFWPIDTGNYRFSRAAAYAGTALAAVEIGDEEVAALCLAALEEECPVGWGEDVSYRPDASVWAHALEFLVRSGRKNSFRNLIEKPCNGRRGPWISDITYPAVLVAHAVSKKDMLSAVLYPGHQPGRQRMKFSGLLPGHVYLCDGAEETGITADAKGEALIHVHLACRKEIRIRRFL